jgi:hypothetical protein
MSTLLSVMMACTSSPPSLRSPPAPHLVQSSETSEPSDPSSPSTSEEEQGDCPSGVTCVDSLPFVHTASTTGGEAELDGYACSSSTNESGPERLYRVQLSEEALLVASLDGLPEGVDVDVHLLEEVDPETCLDRGHWDAAALLPAGTWWVVVDSWVDEGGVVYDGEYTLTLSETRAGDHVTSGLEPDTLAAALFAFDRAWQQGDTDRLEYAVLDFWLPSIEPRLFVLDLRHNELLFAELATHGIGSQDPDDLTRANWFSNVSGSHASSLGLARAAETYWGDNGYSMRLDGLESGFNDNVRDRAIVVHSADYATQAFVDEYGYLGRSQGCPALDPLVSDAVIDTLTEGALLFSYYPDPEWMGASEYLVGF